MPCLFLDLFIHVHRHAGLKFHIKFIRRYLCNLFNQTPDKLIIVFDKSGGLLVKECAHVSHTLFEFITVGVFKEPFDSVNAGGEISIKIHFLLV